MALAGAMALQNYVKRKVETKVDNLSSTQHNVHTSNLIS